MSKTDAMNKLIKTSIKYKAGHIIDREWGYCDDLFCINCGEKKVYGEEGEGDYYVGVEYVCVGCGAEFTLQGGQQRNDETGASLLCQLREGAKK